MITNHDIYQIKQGLNQCRLTAMADGFPKFDAAIARSLDKIDEPMQLAIIGDISSSKSTLVNGILGKNELMPTGQKEVTYNVGWLKYGSPEQDIIIHYKDGTAEKKSREEFNRLAVETDSLDIDRISYIELFDDAEILREINIIDTPGLNALRGKDSQNTLDFIARVRPDAVIVLFTNSIRDTTLDVVRDYNLGCEFTPLNVVGVLAKIDILWQSSFPRPESALKLGRKLAASKLERVPSLRKTLFDIYPISALLFLAASALTQADVDDIRDAYGECPDKFLKLLNKMDNFLHSEDFSLSGDRRRELSDKLGMYGIRLVCQALIANLNASLADVKSILRTESGADDFINVLNNHFGSRAKLIKIESIYQDLMKALHAYETSGNRATAERASRLRQKVIDVFSSSIHEHLEYELLNKIYNHEIELDDEVVAEFCTLSGEHGSSAPEKLGLVPGADVDTLLAKAEERERYWRKEVALEPDPEERKWMRVLLKSYTMLRHQIKLMAYQYQQAQSFLYKSQFTESLSRTKTQKTK